MPNLILIPTSFERDRLLPSLRRVATKVLVSQEWTVELCGFGLVAAAARTAQLIARWQPKQVVLIGIAGSYGNQLTVGQAYRFDAVRCFGIGVGSPDDATFQSAESLGWPQLQLEGASSRVTIGDEIRLRQSKIGTSAGLLLSVTGAAANRQAADRRAMMVPTAVAEDMEGYAVALACELHGVPLTILRGISNVAGQREHSSWQVDQALESAAQLFAAWSSQLDSGPSPSA